MTSQLLISSALTLAVDINPFYKLRCMSVEAEVLAIAYFVSWMTQQPSIAVTEKCGCSPDAHHYSTV